MPTPKQIEKIAALVGRKVPQNPGLAPDADPPAEYWQAILDDRRAEARSGPSEAALRLDHIPKHLLIEVQRVDAVRLYGPQAVWRDVGRRLLENTCTQRTGRLEEDGCWPAFE